MLVKSVDQVAWTFVLSRNSQQSTLALESFVDFLLWVFLFVCLLVFFGIFFLLHQNLAFGLPIAKEPWIVSLIRT